MSEISKALKALIPTEEGQDIDLSSLPQLIGKVEELEQAEVGYMERIDKLQQMNRNYLSQIPIPGSEKEEKEEKEEEKSLTAEDGIKALTNIFKGES